MLWSSEEITRPVAATLEQLEAVVQWWRQQWCWCKDQTGRDGRFATGVTKRAAGEVRIETLGDMRTIEEF